ncbi:chromosome partitioning protein parA [Ligilactobacillus apodemi DSM 16634 = JCM 16172]|uniref:Sporulation initiation inhibitor protein Soj n=1 Tax=Ligilactobacillus apodemi DSM 16634 = JCM 16172 TaxID=1423724 RepID=A0A0R1TY71_9LACO|nr:chromosome partitioning protein parA [Ligilactobacillus apodemi DSM 16634 = JCM 16172]
MANQKGGVGKTTTSVNLAASLADMGQKVLLIDMDAQGNATSGIGVDKGEINQDIYNVLVNEVELDEIILKTTRPTLDVVPATIRLSGAEIELASQFAREKRLADALVLSRDDYDFILLDCPPSLGLLTINAFTTCDSILIPVQSEYYALEGLNQLVNTIKLVKKHYNPALKIEGVLMTMLDARTNLGNQVVSEVKNYFGERVYETVIPRNIKLSEAPSYGMPIADYDPKSKGALAYSALAREVLATNAK